MKRLLVFTALLLALSHTAEARTKRDYSGAFRFVMVQTTTPADVNVSVQYRMQ